jgi:hypothetical protein
MSTLSRLAVLDEVWASTIEEYKLNLLAHTFVMRVGIRRTPEDYSRHLIELEGVLSFVYSGDSTDVWDYIELSSIEAERLSGEGEARWKVSGEWWSSTFEVICECLRIDGHEVHV